MTLNRLALNNVIRDMWTYFAYFISSAFSVFVFFSFSVSMFHPDLSQIKNGSALSMAMMAGSILVYLFSFLFISYSIQSFMKSRAKTFGLFMITGASKKQLNSIIFKENMIIGVMAIVTAIIMGLFVSPLFLMLAKKIMHVEGFTMYAPIKAILLTVIMFFLLFLLISLISPLFIRKRKVIQMLKSDRTDEKKVVFSPFMAVLGLIMMACIVSAFYFSGNNKQITDFINSGMGAFILFGMFLVSLYILYRQLTVFILNVLRTQKMYKRSTNMLIIADMRAKLRSNVNLMYLVTILFTGAFFAIIMLYSANSNVEKDTLTVYPYSYTYVSTDDNPNELAHTQILQDTLKSKEGFKEYQFTLWNSKNLGDSTRQAIMSVTEYNEAVKGINGPTISLEDQQVYVVRDPKNSVANFAISPKMNEWFESIGVVPDVLGISDQSIMPSGLIHTIYVVQDKLIQQAKSELNHLYHVYAYNTAHWKEETATTNQLESQLKRESDVYQFGLFIAGDLYETNKNSKNLMLYVGFFLSVMFFIAASSMIYFRLMTEKEKECLKFKGIVKLGLSRKELSTVIARQLFVLMFVPFAISIGIVNVSISSFGDILDGSYLTFSLGFSIIFLVVQVIGYFSVLSKYKNVVFRDVYLN